MEKLMYWCAGVDLFLIQRASPQDRGRYVMLGVFILFTAALSGISMYFIATYLTTDSVLCGAIALFWSGFIFSIDRYLAISITSFKAHAHAGDYPLTTTGYSYMSQKPENHSSANMSPAKEATNGYLFAILSRLLAAVFLSVVISIPVKLALFEKDINGFLADQNRTERSRYFTQDPELQALKNEREENHHALDNLTQQLQQAEQRVSLRYQDMKAELDGNGSSGKPGFGPYYDQAQNAYQEAKNQLSQARSHYTPEINRLQTRDAEILQHLDNRLAELQKTAEFDNGLLRRYQALSALAHERHEVAISLWLISALFVFIEAFPLLTKASRKRDSYEILLVKLALLSNNDVVENYQWETSHLTPRPASVTASSTEPPPSTRNNVTLIPNQFRTYLILLGVVQCLIFPFAYRYMQGYADSFTPTLILYMFSPISIILAFLVTELLALRSRTLWCCLRPDEDLNFSLQALAVLLAPVSVILYLLLKPEKHLLGNSSVFEINRQPLFDHSNFWIGWGIFVCLVLYFSYRNHAEPLTPAEREKKSRARIRQIQELENRLVQGQHAYQTGCTSLYGLAAACALCSFVMCINLPTTLNREIFFTLHIALISIPVVAVLLASAGLRIPITTALSIANSRLKRLYALLVVFASVTATAMCLLLLLSQIRLPAEPNAPDTTVMNEAQ